LLAPLFVCFGQNASSNSVIIVEALKSAVQRRDGRSIELQRRELLRLEPQNREVHGNAGEWLAGGRYCTPAREEFELALSLGASKKQQAGSHYLLGRCYERVSQASEALAEYRKAVEIEPGEEKFHFALVSLFASQWETGPGEDAAREALTRFPNSARIWVAAGLVELKNGSLGNALEAWRRASSLEPDSPLVTKLLGRIQMAEGRYPEAAQNFQRTTELDSSDAQAWFYLGLACVKIDNQSERALGAFLRAMELNLEAAEAYYWAGSICMQRKHQNEQGIRYLEQAVARAPGWGPANQLLIQAYRATGQNEKAISAARRFRESSQTHRAGVVPVPR
jgi:superkiller protein 3